MFSQYRTIVRRDETTGGGEVWIAYHPELEGCIAQGETMHDAKVNLDALRKEWIVDLIRDGLPVPEPRILRPYEVTTFNIK